VSAADVVRYLADMDDRELHAIGQRAQQRVLSEHTNARRVQQLEAAVEQALRPTVACPEGIGAAS